MSNASELKSVGKTAATDFAIADPDILIGTPKPGTVDNPETAKANVEFEANYARELGKRICVVILVDNLLSQDAETRRIYTEGLGGDILYGVALVTGNALGRAIASFFMGLSKPKVPTKIFDSVESAIAWAQSVRPEE
jgi:hypothetical protein